jgi:hypothetical protein
MDTTSSCGTEKELLGMRTGRLLEGPAGIRVDWVAGIGRGDLRRVMREVERERERLIAMWRRIHAR